MQVDNGSTACVGLRSISRLDGEPAWQTWPTKRHGELLVPVCVVQWRTNCIESDHRRTPYQPQSPNRPFSPELDSAHREPFESTGCLASAGMGGRVVKVMVFLGS